MTRRVRVSKAVADSDSNVSFLSKCLDFNVPEPTPEDDVIEHWWVKVFEESNQFQGVKLYYYENSL